MGDQQALKQLESLHLTRNHIAWRNAEFAKTLISYRLGLNSYLLGRPPGVDILKINPQDSTDLKRAPIDPGSLRGIEPTLHRELPTIQVILTGGVRFQCRSASFLILPNRIFDIHDPFSDSNEENRVAAIIMKKSPSEGVYYLYEYVLMNPARKGVADLFGIRPSGIIVHLGQGDIRKAKIGFHLETLNTPHSPAMEIAGGFYKNKKQLLLTKAHVSTHMMAEQKTRRVPKRLFPLIEYPAEKL
jgi:hypothetical protein